MAWYHSIILYLSIYHLQGAAGLFEDQVGLYDWYQQYVGPVSYVSIDSTMSTNRGVIVASENGVIASIDAVNGDLIWRRVFSSGENGQIDSVLRSQGGSLLTVSKGGKLIRSWEMSTGALKWEVVSDHQSIVQNKPFSLSTSWRPGAAQATLVGKKESLVAIATGRDVSVHNVRNGEKKWTQTLDVDDSAVLCSVYGDESAVHIVTAVEYSKLILSSFDASSGDPLSTRELTAPWFSIETTSCMVTVGYLVCLESSKLDLYHTPLSSDKPFTLTILNTLIDYSTSSPTQLRLAASSDNIWVQVGNTHSLLNLHGAKVSMVTKADDVIPIVGRGDTDVLVRYSDSKLVVEIVGESERSEYELKEHRGRPLLGAVQLTKSGSADYRVALVMEDHTIMMLNKDDVTWNREDALGAIVTVEMLDLPAGQSELIETFVEMTKSESNPLKVAALRAQLQFTLTKDFLMNLNKEVASLLHLDGPNLVRDEFNTRKNIIAATANGKLYGIDSSNGDVVWQSFLSEFVPFQDGRPLLYILRTTSHPPHPPLAVLIGRTVGSWCNDGTVVYEFNPLTGESLNSEPTCLPYHVIEALLLPTLDHTHSKILLLLTSNYKVVTHPSSSEVTTTLTDLNEQLFFLVARQGGSNLTGYRVLLNERGSPTVDDGYSGQLFETETFWYVQFPADSEQIISVERKKAYEHVSSQGNVLADRSVQYKYLNPNLVTVVTESTDPKKSMVTVYLVDSITGGIVHHTSHKYAVGPVHVVHSENWVVYQFLNAKQRRHELVILELYETHTNQSHTVWSSLAPPPIPDVMSQAYAFPTTLTTLTTTQTLRGITYKSVLFGLHSGRVAVMPKALLNPRREIELTDQMKEDGIPPYNPEIAFSPLAFVNYNRTVARLRDIYTTPSGLESTSLVLVCGLDLYYTRVTPSNQFDLLADDFDYTLISAVVVGMFLATVILSRLAARKTLKALWQ